MVFGLPVVSRWCYLKNCVVVLIIALMSFVSARSSSFSSSCISFVAVTPLYSDINAISADRSVDRSIDRSVVAHTYPTDHR